MSYQTKRGFLIRRGMCLMFTTKTWTKMYVYSTMSYIVAQKKSDLKEEEITHARDTAWPTTPARGSVSREHHPCGQSVWMMASSQLRPDTGSTDTTGPWRFGGSVSPVGSLTAAPCRSQENLPVALSSGVREGRELSFASSRDLNVCSVLVRSWRRAASFSFIR